MSQRGKLTKHERRILEMMAEGCTDKEICQSLGMAYSTLRSTVRTRVMMKLDAKTKPHAVAMFLTHGKVLEMKPDRFSEDQCPLSPREREVLLLCAKGHTDGEIAAMLGLNVNTVRSTYWIRTRAKLRAKNRAHAVALFLTGQNGFQGE